MRRSHAVTKAVATLTILACTAAGGFANTVRLKGTYSQDAVFSACDKAGGQGWAGPDGYGCVALCNDHKGGQGSCEVKCNNDGKCTGTTPARIGTGATIKRFLAGARPPAGVMPSASSPPKTQTGIGVSSPGLLDGGPGLSTQGPSRIGTPLPGSGGGGGAAGPSGLR